MVHSAYYNVVSPCDGGNPDETLSLELIAGTSAQNDAQGTGELISSVRLIENRHVQSYAVIIGLRYIAGRQQYLKARTEVPRLCRQLGSIHSPRHDDIGKQYVYSLGPFEMVECFASIASHHDFVMKLFKTFDRHIEDLLVVFHQKNRFPAGGAAERYLARSRLGLLAGSVG